MDEQDTRCRIAELEVTKAKHRPGDELQRRAALTALTYKIACRVSSKLDLDGLLSEVVTAIRDAFDYYGVILLLVDEEAQCLTQQAITGDLACIVPRNLQVAIGEGMTGNAVATGETQLCGNVSQHPRYVSVAGETTKSELAVPIKSGERVIGVLDAQSDQCDAFDEADVMVMETLSTHIAVAIENARLYETVQQELSERKRGEEEILRLSQYLESVIENANVWLNVLDKEGNVVIWNRAAEEITGYSREEVVGHARIWEWLYPDKAYRKEIVGVASEVISGEKAFTEDETTIRCKDGQTKTISWNDRGLLDEGGNAIGSIAIGRDITAHKQAEEALRASEERFALAVEGSNAGIWDWDIRNNTLYWSPRMKEMLGYADDELDADFDTFETTLHPGDKERTSAAIEAHLKDRVPYDVEQRLLTKSGEYIWVHARGQAVWDVNGRPTRMAGSSTDITALKQAEEKLEKERNLLRTLIDNLPDYIFIKDAASRFVINNIAHLGALGATTQDEVVGKTDFDIFPRELAAQYYADEQEVVRSGQPLGNQEEPVMDQTTGDRKWLLTTKVPLRDSHGKIVGLVGIARDITVLKSAEEEIRRLNRYLESIIDNANVWINVLDEKANVILWNKAAEKISGYSREEVVGHNKIWEWNYPDAAYREEVTSKVDAILKNGKADADLETSIRCKDGQTKIISWNSRNLLDDKGTFIGSITIGRDITELREAEEQIQRYIAEIEEANEEIKQFAYIVSHDLRAPLVNLRGFAAELRSALEEVSPAMEAALPNLVEEQRLSVESALQEDIPEALGFIESSVSRMDSFINAVLKLSRLGRRELKLKRIDMDALLEATLNTLAHQIEERKVKMTINPLTEVTADQTAMEQILGNLLTNALIYLDSERPGEIEVGSKREESETTFWVRDNGRGISKYDAPKVFAPFRRAGKQDVPGEGMGLSYVRTMVRQHGGRIWFESNPGEGTTFFFTISNDLSKGESDVR